MENILLGIREEGGGKGHKATLSGDGNAPQVDWNVGYIGVYTCQKRNTQPSLVVQWLRIHLPLQGT